MYRSITALGAASEYPYCRSNITDAKTESVPQQIAGLIPLTVLPNLVSCQGRHRGRKQKLLTFRGLDEFHLAQHFAVSGFVVKGEEITLDSQPSASSITFYCTFRAIRL